MAKYLSLEYWKKVQELANADQEFGIKAKMFAASFTFKVSDKADLQAQSTQSSLMGR